ncbi:MAG: chemotaxis protein CheW [Deltaproteobacteria bacterium]|nr:chemotaxis protein CheW [Deltaproteobacteria bacterium]
MSVPGITETSQYLTFTLDRELFALPIAKVREVLEFTAVTKVPRTPNFMRGVLNLRGNVVPVVDLRLKFGMSCTERTIDSCVVITEVAIDGEMTVLGALADAVQEVLELEPEQIDPPPRIGTRLDTAFIQGMGKHDDQFLILLDIDKVFTSEELDAVGGADSGPAASAA